MFEYFWWASAMARMDTRDSLARVRERDVRLRLRKVAPPEEVTTFNLARRLSYWIPGSVALHSRPLEGGNASTGRLPSGADVEMAVEVRPGVWVDLALQAKKLNPTTGKYNGWKAGQIDNLRRWAHANGKRTPGMLLYNCEPFVSPRTMIELGGCCSSPVRCHGWRWPKWHTPDSRSPAALTLVILSSHDEETATSSPAALNDPELESVQGWSMPLECIFCPRFGAGQASAATGRIPGWAEGLLAASADVGRDDELQLADVNDRVDGSDGSDGSAYSIVLPLSRSHGPS